MAARWMTWLLMGLLVLAWGCEKRSSTGPETEKKAIEVTDAYRRYFGEPPGTLGGSCFGMVGYYPLRADPLQVRPIPHFTFAENTRAQLLVSQMIQGAAPGAGQSLFENPFPPGTSLLSVTFIGVTAVADFSPQLLEQRDPRLQQSILITLGHALIQFEGVENILVNVGGKPVPFQPPDGFHPDENTISPPGPPQILQVVLNDAANVESAETLVFFDRPVTVKNIRLENAEGTPLEGEYFLSVFDMAVVLHPKNPDSIRIGQRLKVIWEVVDGKGRENGGENLLDVVPLSRSS